LGIPFPPSKNGTKAVEGFSRSKSRDDVNPVRKVFMVGIESISKMDLELKYLQ
jgi:hypothetical protein